MNGAATGKVLQQLRERALTGGGGFSNLIRGDFRPDDTAWASIAFFAAGTDGELLEAARHRLAGAQLEDGRVPIFPDYPESMWPTPLAILAWQGSPSFQAAQEKAAAYLLATSGMHWKKDPEADTGHDTDLKGWSWRSDTFAWCEPTSMAMLALEVMGYGGHPRLVEAQRLLLNRQIPGGGWNYGNTTVFGQVLNPMPESTGMVLSALSHRVPQETVQQSLAYLENSFASLKTPRSLGWALLGLSAWGVRPAGASAAIEVSLDRQERFGGYDTSSLALMLVASRATGGLVGLYKA